MAFGKAKAPKADKGPRLSFGKFMAWKSSDVSIAANYIIVNGYLTMFCTDFLGMAAEKVAMILLISNFIDAITDFIIAYIVDNTETKIGKGRPYELGAVGVWVCTLLMFFTPGEWSEGLKTAWIFFMYTFAFGVFNTARGGGQVPYLFRAFSNNKTLIGKVSSYGGLVTTLGSMIISMTFPTVMANLATSTAGWRTLLLIYGIPMLILALPRFLFVKEDTSVVTEAQTDKVKIKDILKMCITNKYAWCYGGIMLIYNVINSIGVGTYYFKYVVGDLSIMSVMGALSVLILPMMLFMPKLLRRWSASQIISFGGAVAVLGYLLIFFAKDNVALLFVGSILTALAGLPISYLGNLIIMDLCTYNEYKRLGRMECSTTVVSNGLASQIGQGIGGAIAGFALGAAGYIESSGDAVVAQPDSAVLMIRVLYSLIPLVLMIGVAVCARLLSKLTKEMPEIESELATRKVREQA